MKVLARILLGLVFAISSVAKLSSLESFELYIFSFGYAGFDLCSIAARLIIIAEFLLGIFLAFNILPRLTRWLTGLSLAGFSIFLLWRAFIGDVESCHCMGNMVDMNPMQSLIKNIILALLLAYVWKDHGRILKHQIPVACITSAAIIIVVFLAFPPDFYYRGSSESHDLSEEAFRPVADSLGLSTGKRAVCFYSGSCEHCKHCVSKMAGIISRHSLPKDSVFVLFMQTHENQDSVATSFFTENGEGLVLPYDYLHPVEFIPLTNGSMPLVVLFEDGELVKEYDYLSINEKELAAFFNDKSH
ncbi:MAG: DoxX family protein [Bacteroidales bacterium]|nr:DoxX family protein [Bacteroidales bacterium]